MLWAGRIGELEPILGYPALDLEDEGLVLIAEKGDFCFAGERVTALTYSPVHEWGRQRGSYT